MILVRSIPHGLNDLLIVDITLYLCLEKILLKIIGRMFIDGVSMSLVRDTILGLVAYFGLKPRRQPHGLL